MREGEEGEERGETEREAGAREVSERHAHARYADVARGGGVGCAGGEGGERPRRRLHIGLLRERYRDRD